MELRESNIKLVVLNTEAKPIVIETIMCVYEEDFFCIYRLDNFDMTFDMSFLIKSRV